MISVTEKNFREVIKDTAILVFWATWCGPCFETNHLQELEDLSKVIIGRVNVEEEPDLSIECSIVMVPTYIFFKKGKIVTRLLGLQTKESLVKMIKDSSF